MRCIQVEGRVSALILRSIYAKSKRWRRNPDVSLSGRGDVAKSLGLIDG